VRLRWGIVIGAVAAAAVAHVVVARAVRGTPLLGAGGFTREMAAALDRPGTEGDAEVRPLRVSFGVAERPPERAADPGLVLDPTSFRRPPDAGAEWPGLPGLAERLAACAEELSREPGEERDALRVSAPGLAVPFAKRSPAFSFMDSAAARDAVALKLRARTRPLPGRFRATEPPSLDRAVEERRPSLDRALSGKASGRSEVRLGIPYVPMPLVPPADWPASRRAIAAPEAFVNITAGGATAAGK